MRFVAMACSLVFLSSSALAEPSLGRQEVEEFCADTGRAQPPSVGIQFDGGTADLRIMTMQAGRYNLPENAAVLLFESGAFIVRTKDYSGPPNGSDGDDMMAQGGLVGGCSREQLSEVMTKNGLDAGLLVR